LIIIISTENFRLLFGDVAAVRRGLQAHFLLVAKRSPPPAPAGGVSIIKNNICCLNINKGEII